MLCAILMQPLVRWLKDKQIGQFIREEGPASHSGKASTPTMGGLCFIFASSVSTLGWLHFLGAIEPGVLIVLLVAVLCGMIGLVDDLAKFRRKANRGLSARLRLVLEACLGAFLGLFLMSSGEGARLYLTDFHLGMGVQAVMLSPVFYVLTASFLMAATTNAVNLHDGMDGLAAGTAMQILAVMAIILVGTGQWTLACLAASGAGSVAAFLLFNRYPASIFMGDTGSLFIGGLMAGLAVAGGLELWFIPLALIYIVETISVIAQVVYFKLTKDYKPNLPMSRLALLWLKLTKRLPGEGKRLLRMAPLHHHFESLGADRGLAEWQVVTGFWLAQLVLCAIVLLVWVWTIA